VVHHARSNPLEADRRLNGLLAERGGQPVQQVRGCKVAHDRAALPLHLVQIPVQEQQQVVDVDILAPLIDQRDAVRVAVGGQPQVVVFVAHICAQQAQRVEVRRGRAAAEQRIAPLVDEGDAAARLVEDNAERQMCDAIHRVDDDPQARLADRGHVDERLHPVHVLVDEVATLDNARRDGDFQRHGN